MKCPKCGTENVDNYKFCRKCGEPRSNGSNINNSNFKDIILKIINYFADLFKKDKKLFRLVVIIIIAFAIFGISNLINGEISSGNEKIINMVQEDYSCPTISFTLTNAPDDADTYDAKAIWYDSNNHTIGSKIYPLDYEIINSDNTMDIVIYGPSELENKTISKCVVEVTNNQGDVVASSECNWINN